MKLPRLQCVQVRKDLGSGRKDDGVLRCPDGRASPGAGRLICGSRISLGFRHYAAWASWSMRASSIFRNSASDVELLEILWAQPARRNAASMSEKDGSVLCRLQGPQDITAKRD